MEEGSEATRAAIYKTILNQIHDNNPPETKQTHDRLLALGKSKNEVMDLLGAVLSVEVFETLKHKEPFNKIRFLKNLAKLPELPF